MAVIVEKNDRPVSRQLPLHPALRHQLDHKVVLAAQAHGGRVDVDTLLRLAMEAWQQQVLQHTRELTELFRLHDSNRDGEISFYEFQRLASDCLQRLPDAARHVDARLLQQQEQPLHRRASSVDISMDEIEREFTEVAGRGDADPTSMGPADFALLAEECMTFQPGGPGSAAGGSCLGALLRRYLLRVNDPGASSLGEAGMGALKRRAVLQIERVMRGSLARARAALEQRSGTSTSNSRGASTGVAGMAAQPNSQGRSKGGSRQKAHPVNAHDPRRGSSDATVGNFDVSVL